MASAFSSHVSGYNLRSFAATQQTAARPAIGSTANNAIDLTSDVEDGKELELLDPVSDSTVSPRIFAMERRNQTCAAAANTAGFDGGNEGDLSIPSGSPRNSPPTFISSIQAVGQVQLGSLKCGSLPPPQTSGASTYSTRRSIQVKTHSSAIAQRSRQSKLPEHSLGGYERLLVQTIVPTARPVNVPTARQARLCRTSRRARKKIDPEIQVLGLAHRELQFWKDKWFDDLDINADFHLAIVAASRFDRATITTVVPNRYFASVELKSDRFPGTVEIQDAGKAIRQAYAENTAPQRDVSRLVLWTDGSGNRGLAVAWRCSKPTAWDQWEAAGYQAAGLYIGSDGMEHLAVIKAFDRACELVQQSSGQLTTVAIYTDSQSVLNGLKWTVYKPLARQIAKRAHSLKQLGVRTIALHWVPGHSRVPGNELADKVAGFANNHSFRHLTEHIDLSDDEA